MGAIATILFSKGLPILAGAFINRFLDKTKLVEKIGRALGYKKITEKELKEKLEHGLSREEFQILSDLQYDIAVEAEVTKRLEIDNNAESWLTRHIRPLTLIFTSVMTMIYLFCVTFIDINEAKIGMVEFLGNYLFLMNGGVFGFYFGGRTIEKTQKTRAASIPEIK